MPIKKSAKKAVRQTKKRTGFNRKIKETAKKAVKNVDKAITEGSKNIAEDIRLAQKAIDKAAKAGIFHKNKAARKVSQLARKLQIKKVEKKEKTS